MTLDEYLEADGGWAYFPASPVTPPLWSKQFPGTPCAHNNREGISVHLTKHLFVPGHPWYTLRLKAMNSRRLWITLEVDLDNPVEEIPIMLPRLLAAWEEMNK